MFSSTYVHIYTHRNSAHIYICIYTHMQYIYIHICISIYTQALESQGIYNIYNIYIYIHIRYIFSTMITMIPMVPSWNSRTTCWTDRASSRRRMGSSSCDSSNVSVPTGSMSFRPGMERFQLSMDEDILFNYLDISMEI